MRVRYKYTYLGGNALKIFKNIIQSKGRLLVGGTLLLSIIIIMQMSFSILSKNIGYYKEEILKNNIQFYKSKDKITDYNNLIIDILTSNNISPFYIMSKENSIFNGFYSMENHGSKVDIDEYVLSEEDIKRQKIEEENTEKNIRELDINNPKVLIYHSHTTEAYSPAQPDTTDSSMTVVGVGEVIKKNLEEKYGIAVVHDTTVHNSVYLKSYVRSGETVDKYLENYKDFDLIIDLHRDAGSNKEPFTVKLKDKDYSKIMFVMTKKNPNFDENYKVVTSLMEISDYLYPQFSRGVMYYDYGTKFFNQDKSPNSILIEVGSDKNLVDESMNSGELLSEIIAKYIDSLE